MLLGGRIFSGALSTIVFHEEIVLFGCINDFFNIGCYLVTSIWLALSYLGLVQSSEIVFILVPEFVSTW